MKNTLYLFVESKYALPECWVFENKQYRHIKSDSREKILPSVNEDEAEVLKELKIPYRIVKKGESIKCEYWDPNVYEEEEHTLPLYLKQTTGYRNMNKNHTGKEITDKTIEAAKILETKILPYVQEFKEKKKLYDEIKGIIGEKTICSYHRNRIRTEEIIFNNEHFKIIPVKIIERSGYLSTCWHVIFNVNKIEVNSEIVLEVPKEIVGLFIGKKAWQVKEWCKQFGLRKINVVGTE